MAEGHEGVTLSAIRDWHLGPDAVVLDVGCGNGWAVRHMVEQGAGRGLGVDIAPQMVRLAQEKTRGDDRFDFQAGLADALPWPASSVSHLLSVESIYYYPDVRGALSEWARVTRAGGRLAVVIDLYEESPATHNWIDALDVEVHLLSAPGLSAMAEDAGWSQVHTEQVLDPRPLAPQADFEISKYWPSYEQYLRYRQAGALVLHGVR